MLLLLLLLELLLFPLFPSSCTRTGVTLMNSGGDWCSISVGSLEERAGFTGTGTAVDAMEVEVEEEGL